MRREKTLPLVLPIECTLPFHRMQSSSLMRYVSRDSTCSVTVTAIRLTLE